MFQNGDGLKAQSRTEGNSGNRRQSLRQTKQIPSLTQKSESRQADEASHASDVDPIVASMCIKQPQSQISLASASESHEQRLRVVVLK